ncbi:MAG: DUF5719 family protein [Egibacteraceae bacterium]
MSARARRARQAPRRPPRGPIALIVVAVLAAGGLLAADAAVAPAEPSPPPGQEWEVDAGTAHCPVTTEDEEAEARVVVAGSGEAEVVVRQDDEVVDELDVDIGEAAEVAVDPARLVEVAWRGEPVAATWHVENATSAAGPCPATPSSTWRLAGIDTTLGSEARLHLANPYRVDAVAQVRFGTAEGPVDLVRTQNVAVPAGETEVLDLVELQPEEPELGVTIETLAGRVLAQGEVERERLPEDDTGVAGRALVPAVIEDGVLWQFATIRDDGNWDGELAVYNPSDRQAAVVVRPTSPAGDAVSEEILVPAGSVGRIDLEGRSEEDQFGVVLESINDVAVVAARVEGNPAGERTGYTVSPGTARAAESWLVPGTAGERDDSIALLNPGAEAVSVTVVSDGASVEGWEDRPLEPDTREVIGDVDLPALVYADGLVVAEQLSALTDGDDLGRLSGLGVPLREEQRSGLGVRREPALAFEPILPPGEEVGEDDDGETPSLEDLDFDDFDLDEDDEGESEGEDGGEGGGDEADPDDGGDEAESGDGDEGESNGGGGEGEPGDGEDGEPGDGEDGDGEDGEEGDPDAGEGEENGDGGEG